MSTFMFNPSDMPVAHTATGRTVNMMWATGLRFSCRTSALSLDVNVLYPFRKQHNLWRKGAVSIANYKIITNRKHHQCHNNVHLLAQHCHLHNSRVRDTACWTNATHHHCHHDQHHHHHYNYIIIRVTRLDIHSYKSTKALCAYTPRNKITVQMSLIIDHISTPTCSFRRPHFNSSSSKRHWYCRIVVIIISIIGIAMVILMQTEGGTASTFLNHCACPLPPPIRIYCNNPCPRRPYTPSLPAAHRFWSARPHPSPEEQAESVTHLKHHPPYLITACNLARASE